MKQSKFPYDQQIEMLTIEAFKSSGFLIVNKTLIKRFGLMSAAILSNYIDKHIYFRKQFPDNNGWFYLTHKQQMDQLGVKEYSLRKCKRELIGIDILEIERRGIPAKEWFKINFIKLVSIVGQDLTNSIGLETTNSIGHINKGEQNKGEQNNNKYIQLKEKGKLSTQERTKLYLPIAKFLYEIIQTKKNINKSPEEIYGWADSIRLLIETNKVSVKRIKNALKWYKQNIGGEYIPIIESGSSLRYKFTKLEDAIERSKNPYGNNKPKSGSRRFRKETDYIDHDSKL